MQTVILLGLVSLLTDISSEMVYPLLSLYLTTTLVHVCINTMTYFYCSNYLDQA